MLEAACGSARPSHEGLARVDRGLNHTGLERAARVPFGSMISIFRQYQLTTVREAGGTGRRNEPDELVGQVQHRAAIWSGPIAA